MLILKEIQDIMLIHKVPKDIILNRKDILDIVSGQYLAKGVRGSCTIDIPADAAVLAVELPAGMNVKDNTILYEKNN